MKSLLLGGVVAAVALVPVDANAQSAGSNIVTLGWMHITPMQHSTSISTDVTTTPIDSSLRLPRSFDSAGTALTVSGTDTVGLTVSHFLTDHVAVTMLGGFPPLVSIKAQGNVVPPGPAGVLGNLNAGDPALNPVVKSARAWTPTALLQYYFAGANSKFRPFVGVGASYAWFSDIQLSNNFIAGVRQSLGAPLSAAAAKPGVTQVQAKASPSWNPVANAGFTYNLTPHLGITASVTYMPLQTTATIYVKSADGSVLSESKSKLTVDPLVSFVGMSYVF
ncbi:OmpW family protein [Burkholderia vietnamiensis]|uniref:OmpW family protein n=1 Tax=Burkholderia vietnamiensis TaxID=60552 RepID=A0AAW7SVR6_BURVI|nr:OmpW family protein [Burkholderia vietnamiensis]MBH9645868.1 OmpW family protein [Burkholderia vietnamiensis]MBR8008823.1 OmpW family protein [Burkholderia vietnamiensis]MDN7551318.1 OmpW family protein [Burkholderia vietnamiensis]MDN7795132.1 OmpW family protein [Burkholderia vietnamiensis]MDN8045142.1 OmpW family protein [Burkholderia vietnamiensis]